MRGRLANERPYPSHDTSGLVTGLPNLHAVKSLPSGRLNRGDVLLAYLGLWVVGMYGYRPDVILCVCVISGAVALKALSRDTSFFVLFAGLRESEMWIGLFLCPACWTGFSEQVLATPVDTRPVQSYACLLRCGASEATEAIKALMQIWNG
ncbi:hypothetical protein F4809DRAFT_633388 [Biscogniauxia mediterranea]|nr:hypothetical protein F4809DRAFT_633388 [Biscogniauxia mediterranea]